MIKENGRQYHVVDWNQSLGEIAQKYGITIQQLQQANGLNNIQIHPGQRLEIPARTDDSLASPILNANASGIQ